MKIQKTRKKQLRMFSLDHVVEPPTSETLGRLAAALITHQGLDVKARMAVLSLAYLTGLRKNVAISWQRLEASTGASRSELYWSENQLVKYKRVCPLQQAVDAGFLVWKKGQNHAHPATYTVLLPV